MLVVQNEMQFCFFSKKKCTNCTKICGSYARAYARPVTGSVMAFQAVRLVNAACFGRLIFSGFFLKLWIFYV